MAGLSSANTTATRMVNPWHREPTAAGGRIAGCREGGQSNDGDFAGDGRAVNSRSAAAEQVFAGSRVTRDDPVELVLRGAKMISDEFTQNRAIINDAFEIAALDAEHRAGLAGHPPQRMPV